MADSPTPSNNGRVTFKHVAYALGALLMTVVSLSQGWVVTTIIDHDSAIAVLEAKQTDGSAMIQRELTEIKAAIQQLGND